MNARRCEALGSQRRAHCAGYAVSSGSNFIDTEFKQ
jgi:hypothetical protein